MYLVMFPNTRRPSTTSVLEHPEVLLEQDQVRRFLRDVDGVVHRDTHVGRPQRRRR